MKLLAIIKKNIKFLAHHKMSTLIVIFGPLILIVLAGLAFSNTGLHGIKLGLHTNNNNSILDSLINQVRSDDYKIVNYASLDDCQSDLKLHKVHMCLDYDDSKKNLRFLVDPSKTNLVYTLLNVLSSKMNSATDNVSYSLTSAMLDQLSKMDTLLNEKKGAINDLIKSSENLEQNLNKLSEHVMTFELQFDTSVFDDIKERTVQDSKKIHEFKITINDRIYHSINSLNEYGAEARDLQEEIDRRSKEKKELEADLDNSFDYYNCQNKSYKDLTVYSDDPDELLAEITTSPDPECSYIYTIKKNIDACTGDLDMASEKVSSLRTDIRTTKNELRDFKDSANEAFDQADTDLSKTSNSLDDVGNNIHSLKQKLNKTKSNLSNSLSTMGGSVNQSLVFLVKFNGSLENMSNKMNKISKISPSSLINPVINTVQGIDNKGRNTIDFLFPTLLMFVIMFVGIMLGNILITKEKNSRAFFRNLISPTNSNLMLLGTFLTTELVVALQTVIILVLAFLFMSLNVDFMILDVVIILLMAITIFTCIGISLGNIIDSEETSVIVSVLLSIVLLIFSSTILPLESMPIIAQYFVKINPFYLVTQLLTNPLIHSISILKSPGQLILLMLLLLLMIFLTFKSFEYSKNRIENE